MKQEFKDTKCRPRRGGTFLSNLYLNLSSSSLKCVLAVSDKWLCGAEISRGVLSSNCSNSGSFLLKCVNIWVGEFQLSSERLHAQFKWVKSTPILQQNENCYCSNMHFISVLHLHMLKFVTKYTSLNGWREVIFTPDAARVFIVRICQ